ncbi:hypothetical protein CCH79_00021013, partial [Gambusia affinis]
MEGGAAARRRPLVRAASEDSASDSTSGGFYPLPGDTLPWNLQKHQRMKRSKSASGDVLDPAERAVVRIAGEALRRRLPCQTDARRAIYAALQLAGFLLA